MTRRNLPVETGGPERQPSIGKKEEVGRPGGWIKLEYLKNNPSQRQGADEVREERERAGSRVPWSHRKDFWIPH